MRRFHDNGLTEEPCPCCGWKLRWAWAPGSMTYLKCDTKGCTYESKKSQVESTYNQPWELDWNLQVCEDWL